MKALAAVLALVASFVTTSASAQNTYSVYLDAAGHHNSGCNITLPGGTFANADVRIQAAVTPGNSPQVNSVTLSHCSGGVWQAGTVIGGGYPVDLNMGVSGADSIEMAVSTAGILTPNNPQLRMGFTAENAGGSDVLFTVDGSAGGPAIIFGTPVAPIPALGFGAIALLILLLALIARRQGRSRLYSRIMAASFLAASGIAAGAFVLFDWTGIAPIATDATGDSTNGSPDIDIRAGFVAFKAGKLYFRIDVVDVQTAPPAITSANATTFIVGQPGTFTVTSTGIPTPTVTLTGCVLPAGVTFTSNANGTGTLAGTPPAGSANTYNCTITANNGVPPAAVQAFTLTIANAPSVTTLVSGTNPSVFGQAVTFTATVAPAPPGSGTPTGTVTFFDGATNIGTGALNGAAQATFTTTTLSVGTHAITAQYGGDVNFGPSTSSAVNQVVNKAASTTALVSSANPSVFGQNVTFTATVALTAPGAGTATGTVTFKDGATTLGTGTLAGGVATFSTSTLSVGTHPITAVYGGDTNVQPSTSSAVSQVVNQATTTTAVASSANPSVFGQNVTFTATVTPNAPSTGTPTGTVTFKDGAATLGTGTLTAGVATFSTATLSLGAHSITAVYGGDTNDAGSTSVALTQTVNQGATTTTVVAAPNPSIFNQSVTFTATVTATAPAAGTPTGTVTFMDGFTTLGPGTLNGSGVATYSTSTLALGPHQITAVYGGDTNFAGSSSAPLNQVVNQAGSATALVSGTNPSVFGQSVTFTATVTAAPPASGTPTGTVTFFDGATNLGTGTLNGSGVATFATSTLSVGTHAITAQYGGDANFGTSTSTAVSQVVNQAASTTAVASNANPSVFGQNVTFTATVSVTAPGAGTATGTVTFKDGATTLGTGTLAGGVATFSTSTLSVGAHSITAAYGGDTNVTASTSAPLAQTVNKTATTTTVVGAPNPSVFGQAVTFTATVTATAPGGGTPTGTATFFDGVTNLGTGALNGSGVATLSTNTLAVGAHQITAQYGGDTNDNGSTSAILTQTVNKGATTTALAAAPNPSVINQSVTLTATVTATAPAAGTPTGNVTFFDGFTNIGTSPLAAGVATLNVSTLTIGPHSLTAVYGADTNFLASTSAPVTQVVNAGASSTALVSSLNPALFGASVTFTATVTAVAPASGTPTGTVTFFDGATNIGTGVLNGSGVATLTTTTLSPGTHSITAQYGGDANFSASTGGPLTQTINQAPAITSANSATFSIGSANTFTVTTTGFPTGAAMVISETGALPGGVTFVNNNNGTATLSGTPIAGSGGSYVLTITANNGIAPNANQTFTLTVNQAPTITSANTTTFTVGAAGTFTVTTTGSPTGPAMVISETGALPGGVTFVNNNNGTATLSGTPAAGTGGSYPITITANNGVAPNATQSFTLVINQAPAITSANNTTFAVGSAGTFTVTTTGFPSGASMAISETGALPGGVTFTNNNNGTATLAGTPTAGGTFPITITANNGVAPNATQSFTLTVNQAPTITSANNATFTVGTPGTFTVTTTGLPTGAAMIISETGALPGGVTFVNNNDGTATLAGTPAAATGGSYALTITANNGVAPNATQSFTLTVNQAPAITSANNTTFKVGTAGTFTVTTTGFPSGAAMNISETGALPGGVTFTNNNDGTATLAGTPTANGTFPITITANNGVGSPATQSFTLTVNEAPTITSANTTTFTVGSAGTFTVTTTGFPTNASMIISETGALPGGVTFVNNNNGTATLAGTPGAGTGGSYAITITANNGVAPNATQSFTLIVQQAPAITSANSTTFTVGAPGTFTVTTTGFPTGASMAISETGTLPSGVSFVNNNNGTATLAGTPGALTQNASPYALTVNANNGVAPPASQAFTLNVVCPVITVSGTIADQIYNTAMPTATFTQSGGNGAITWSAVGLAPGESIGSGTGQVTGTPTNTGTFPTTVTATDAFGCSGSKVLTYNVNPGANNDAYSALGNVIVNSASVPFAVTDNDLFPAGTTISAFDAASTGGGTVTMVTTAGATLGQFTYNPPVGKNSGTDTFTYTLSSNGRTATGTVTFTIAGRLWFIDDTASACSSNCDGRMTNPFTNTSTFQTANTGAVGKPAANDPIFVYTGGSAYSGAITLLNGQRLIGQGATTPLATLASVTPQSGQTLPATGGAQPNLTSGGTTITLGSGNFIQGLQLGNATVALLGSSFGTLTVNNNVTINTNGEAMSLTTGTLTATFEGVTSSGGVNNINLISVGGTSNFSNSIAGSLSGATGTAFVIGNATAGTGGTPTITYNGSITASAGQAPIVFQNRTSGTVTLNGAVTSSAQGIQLLNNTGATTAFTGTLILSTGANAAFTATGGGTVTATDVNSTLTTTTGTALNVANTTIGAGNLKFKSITAGTGASGPVNGIVLNNTGASGGLKVLGVGTTAGTGGTIQKSSGPNVLLMTTVNVALNNMNITGGLDDGIHGESVTNLDLIGCSITANGNSTLDDGLQLGLESGATVGILGTLNIINTDISSNAHNGVHIRNTSGTLAAMNVAGSSFNNAVGANSANAFLFEMSLTAVTTTASITGSTFANSSPERALEVQSHDTSTISAFAVTGNTFNNNGIHADFSQDGASNLTFTFSNNGTAANPMVSTVLAALNIFSSSTSTGGTIRGRVENNFIGKAGTTIGGNGIRALIQGKTLGTLLFNNNTLRNIGLPSNGARGMDIEFLGPTATGQGITQSDVTLTNNDVDTTAPAGGFPLAAIYLAADDQGSPARVRANISGNNARNSVTGGSWDYPTFDGNGAQLIFLTVGGAAEAQLVGAGTAQTQLVSNNPSTIAARIYSSGVTTIPGPITTPP